MERKYLDCLVKWKDDPLRKPLMVWGARQVGKSYLVEELFAKNHFKGKYLRIDCSDDSLFVDYVRRNGNLSDVLDYIEIHYGFKADKDHLLFFDEVQECLPLVKMMKHFCEKRRDIPVIESGSLVRIKIFRENHRRGQKEGDGKFLFPVGKINQLNVYPMTFDEFLFNLNPSAYRYVEEHYRNRLRINGAMHSELLAKFADYLFVGGMPEAVEAFLLNKADRTKSYEKASSTIKDIYDNYLSDMDLYQASPESIIRSRMIYKDIYKQLNKENKNFKFSLTEKGAKSRDMMNPIGWLALAKIVNQAFQLKERVTAPLIKEEDSLMRLYLADMGLFAFQSGLNFRSFLLDPNNAFSGIYFENYVSTELVANGFDLFYWKGKRNCEFEFVIASGNRIIPIDVKKGRDRLSSLAEFRQHNKTDLAIKISANQCGYDENSKLLTLPFYYVPFFLKDLQEGTFDERSFAGIGQN